MTIDQAMAYLYHTMGANQPRGLERMKRLLEALDNPHESLKFIHVAGTNGKGSTVSFISTILSAAGYRVGKYTSPGLMRFNERIVVNDIEIPDREVCEYVVKVRKAVEKTFQINEPSPSFFELTLAVALLYYRDCRCDIVVLEVGLGGRFDATNVIERPEVAVITTIDFDHMDRLGNTIEEIAFEKAGIIKEKGHVVLYPQCGEAEGVILQRVESLEAHVKRIETQSVLNLSVGAKEQCFDYGHFKGLKIQMRGSHQIYNAITALEAVLILVSKGYKISNEAVYDGLYQTNWPGRFELLQTSPDVIVDAAHNAEGVKKLYENLKSYYPNQKISFIFGVMADKDHRLLIQSVKDISYKFYCVTPSNERALSAEELAIEVRSEGIDAEVCTSSKDALQRALTDAKEDSNQGVICAFGSFYYIGDIRAYYGKY